MRTTSSDYAVNAIQTRLFVLLNRLIEYILQRLLAKFET